MKNTVSYYTKESLEQVKSSLIISNSKDSVLADDFFQPDFKNLVRTIKKSITDAVYIREASIKTSSETKEIEYSNNCSIIAQETTQNILAGVKKLIETSDIVVKEKKVIKENFENAETVIVKNKKQTASSALLMFRKVDLELDTGLIYIDGPNGSKEAIKFEEILDLWSKRSTYLNKQHFFIILETINDAFLTFKQNEFIKMIKRKYYFKSVSLLIIPNLDLAKDIKFNRYNFIGNKVTILRDFNINLISNSIQQSSIQSIENSFRNERREKKEKEAYLNNTKIINYGYDELQALETKYTNTNRSGNAMNQLVDNRIYYSTVYFPNGEYYEGEVDAEYKPHGFGTQIYLDSTTYSGYFNKGQREGKGCFINPDFTTSYMIWRNDQQNGFMKKYHFDESVLVYEGNVEKGKYHGPGKLYWDEGMYEGYFEFGKKIEGTIFLKNKKKAYYEAYKGVFDNDKPAKIGKVTIPHTSKDNYYNVHIGTVDIKETGDLEIKTGSSNVNHVITSPADSCYGSRFLPKTLDDCVWKIDKTAVAVATLVRTKHYFDRINEEKEQDEQIHEFTDTDNLLVKGFDGLVNFFNGDIYIGETTEYLPNGYGILWRQSKCQYEIGQFSKTNYNTEDKKPIRLYFLDKGIYLGSQNSFEIVDRKEYFETEFMETVQFRANEFLYKGRAIPIWEKMIANKKEIANKNVLLRTNKTDINSIYLDFKNNIEYKAVIKDDIFTSGIKTIKKTVNNCTTRTVYTGKFNDNGQFHGYGELVFDNHPLYKKFSGEFVDGDIEGIGEMEYRSFSVEKGYFRRIKPKNDKEEFDINSATYTIIGNSQRYYPTKSPVYTTGFKVGNHFIRETYISRVGKDKDTNKTKKAEGKTVFNHSLNKEVFELDKHDNNRKINILIEDLQDNFRIMALTFESDGSLAKVNVKMENDYTYYGSLNKDFQMEGVGKLFQKNKGEYIGNFKNNKFHNVGQRTDFIVVEGQHCDPNIKKAQMKTVELGTFMNGHLEGEICQKSMVFADPTQVKKPFLKGYFGLEYGEFKQGNLLKGCKELFSNSTASTIIMLVGRFHVPHIQDLEFNKPGNTTGLTVSKPILKGVKMIKMMNNSPGTDIFGGKIVESNYLPGKYTMHKSGIKFYTISYQITEKMQKVEYRIKLISQFSEFIKKESNWDDVRDLKQTINGKGRLYKLSLASKQMSEKTTRNELNDTLNILYEGDFSLGRFDGKGIIYYDNGDVFFGDIKNSELDLNKNLYPHKGQFGTFIQPLVGIQTGFFNDEQLNGRAVVIYQNGIKYRGETKNGRNHGKGSLFFPDGTHYEGHFYEDNLIGPSKFYYTNGDCLVCTLDENSQINGEGIYTKQDGTEIKGKFVGNKMFGLGIKKFKDFEIMGELKEFEPYGTVCIKNKDFRAFGVVDENGLFKGKIKERRTGLSQECELTFKDVNDFLREAWDKSSSS